MYSQTLREKLDQVNAVRSNAFRDSSEASVATLFGIGLCQHALQLEIQIAELEVLEDIAHELSARRPYEN